MAAGGSSCAGPSRSPSAVGPLRQGRRGRRRGKVRRPGLGHEKRARFDHGLAQLLESGTVNLASRAPCALFEDDGELVCSGSSATIGGRARLADGRRVNFNQDPNGNPRGFETYSAVKHAYNSNPFLNAVNSIKRVGMTAFGNAHPNDSVDLFAELMFTNRKSEQLATPGSIGAVRPIRIAAGHPTNPTGQDLMLERRRVAEVGPRTFFQETNTFRIATGLKGVVND
ncbi:MAG: hypothetical protein ACXW2U_02255 [Telluria sp.]